MNLVRLLLTVIGLMALVHAPAFGAYPERAVRIVVAYAPGGATDVLARKMAQKLTEQMGQTFFVENKPGATGIIGSQQVARAPGDGYTLLAMDNTYTILPYVFKSLPWNHETAFTPITVIAFSPVLVCVRTQSSFKDLKELLAAARANPGKLTYGTGGTGSAPHFATEAFQQAAGIKLTHVPYKGAGDAMTALISGEVALIFVSTPGAGAQLQGNRIRSLAISGKKRFAAWPDIPTFGEAGVPGFGVTNWTGLAAPGDTPKAIIDRLYQEAMKAFEAPDMKKFIAELGSEPGGNTPAAFAGLIKEESAGWLSVAQKADIERQ